MYILDIIFIKKIISYLSLYISTFSFVNIKSLYSLLQFKRLVNV